MNPYFEDVRPPVVYGRTIPAWAQHTAAWGRTGEVPPEPPGGYPPSNPPPWVTDPQKPSRVIVWVLGALGVFLVLCLGGIGLAVAGAPDPEPSNTVVTTEPTTPPTTRPTTPATTEPTTVPPPAEPKKVAAPISFEDGLHEVGTDIRPGTYRLAEPVTGSDFCYWKKSKDAEGDKIIDNDLASTGRLQVTLKTGQWFQSERCGTWVRK